MYKKLLLLLILMSLPLNAVGQVYALRPTAAENSEQNIFEYGIKTKTSSAGILAPASDYLGNVRTYTSADGYDDGKPYYRWYEPHRPPIQLTKPQRARVLKDAKAYLEFILSARPSALLECLANLGLDVSSLTGDFEISFYSSGEKKDAMKVNYIVDNKQVFTFIMKTNLRNDNALFEEGELEAYDRLQGTEYVSKKGGLLYVDYQGMVTFDKPAYTDKAILIEEFIKGPTYAKEWGREPHLNVSNARECLSTLLKVYFYLNDGNKENMIAPFDYHRANLVKNRDGEHPKAILVDLGRQVKYDNIEDYILGLVYYYSGRKGKALSILYEDWPEKDWDKILIRLRRKIFNIKNSYFTEVFNNVEYETRYQLERADCNRMAKAITAFLVNERGIKFRNNEGHFTSDTKPTIVEINYNIEQSISAAA